MHKGFKCTGLIMIAISGMTVTSCSGVEATTAISASAITASPDPPSSAPSSASPYAGTSWTVTSVKHAGKSISVLAAWRAIVTFEPGGRINMVDTVVPISGDYRETSTGFTVSITAIGAIAVNRSSMADDRLVVLDAIDSVAGLPEGGISRKGYPSTEVKAKVANRKMALSVQNYELILDRREQIG